MQRTRQEARALVDQQLATVGFDIESLFQLKSRGLRYDAALHVLIELIGKTGDGLYDDFVVRWLAAPWARDIVAQPLIEAFGSELPPWSNYEYRWAIGDSIEIIAWPGIEADVLRLVADERFGDDRQMLVMALGRLRSSSSLAMLQSLLDSPSEVMVIESIKTLRKHRKTDQVLDKLEQLANDSRCDVAAYASKVLSRIREADQRKRAKQHDSTDSL